MVRDPKPQMTRHITAATLLTLLGLTLVAGQAGAQGCCTPGSSPMGGVTGGPSHAGSIELGFSSEWFELDRAYENSQQIEDPGGRYSRVLSSNLFLRLGLSQRLLAVAQLPFDDRLRRQTLTTPSGSTEYEFRNTAMGDLGTMLLARIVPWSGFGRTVVNLGAGVKFPTGASDATQDGLIIPFELQTGTGTYDPIAALSSYHLTTWGSIEAVATARFPTRAESGYKYGVESTALLQASWDHGSWQIGPQFRGRFAGTNDMRGRTVARTGGHRIMGGLHALLSLSRIGIQIDAAALLPIWQNLYGLQLGVTSQLMIAMRWSP